MPNPHLADTLVHLRAARPSPGRHGRRAPEMPALDASVAFAHATPAIAVTDEHLRIVVANPAYASLMGMASERCIGTVLPGVPPAPSEGETLEVVLRRADGSLRTAWLQWQHVTDGSGAVRGHVATFTDISALDRERALLRHLAQHDALTQLPNRLRMRDELERAVARALRHGHKLALLFVDLDRFKWVNDTLGHDAGDTVLQEVGRRLRQGVRSEDVVGRWGGDEFLVLLNEPAGRASALRIAELLRRAIGREITAGGHRASTAASIGVALYPDDADDASGLVRAADAAMYRTKRQRRSSAVGDAFLD